MRPAVLAVLFLTFVASFASAQECFIAPLEWEPEAGDVLTFHRHCGSGFQGGADARIGKLHLRGANEYGQRAQGEAPRVRVVDDGGALVAVESDPTSRDRSPAEWDDRATTAGLSGLARARSEAAFSRGSRERLLRSEKLWIDGDDARRVRRPLGLPLELTPRRNPSRSTRVTVELAFHGRPVAGALVRSWRQPLQTDGTASDPAARLRLPVHEELRTDRLGRVRLDVAARGEWLVSAAHAVPSRAPDAPGWDVFETTLAFSRPASDSVSATMRRPLRGTGLGRNPDLGLTLTDRSRSVRDIPGWGR